MMGFLKSFLLLMYNLVAKVGRLIARAYLAVEKNLKVPENMAKDNLSYLQLAVDEIGADALRNVFHDVCKYPRDKGQLYQILLKRKQIIEEKKQRCRIAKSQFDLLLPRNSAETNSNTFDVTLLFFLLTEICNLSPPRTDWNKDPDPNDHSTGADVKRIYNLRNTLKHLRNLKVQEVWEELKEACKRLRCQKDINSYRPRLFLVRRIKYFVLGVAHAIVKNLLLTPIVFGWNKAYMVFKEKKKIRSIRDRIVNVDMFLERTVLLNNMLDTIENKENKVGLVLAGLGGVGKTELAKAICNSTIAKDANLIWIEADNKDKIKSAFTQVLEKLDEQAPVDELGVTSHKLYDRLQGAATFIVLDNVENPKDIEDAQPADTFKNVFLVVTSQNKNWPSKDYIVREIGVYTEDEAVEFIKTELEATISVRYNEEEEIYGVVNEIGCLPLAVTQFISYMNENLEYTVTEYHEQFKKSTQEFIQLEAGSYKRTVLVTLNLAKEKLEPETLLLYQMMAFLDGQLINKSLLMGLRSIISNEKFSNNDYLKKLVVPVNLNEALKKLKNYSLINVSYNEDCTEQIINFHSLMQFATRLDLSKNDDKITNVLPALLDAHLLHLLAKKENAGEVNKSHFEYGKHWLNHTVQVIRNCEAGKLAEPILELLDLDEQCSLKEALMSKGNYQTCFDMYRTFFSVLENNESSKRNEISYIVAYCLLKNGKYKPGKDEFEKLLNQLESDSNIEDEDRRLEIQYFIGHCLMKSEKYHESMEKLTITQHKQAEKYSEDSQQYLLTSHDIAYCKFKLARYKEAKDDYDWILPAQTRVCGPLHKDTLLTSHSLGHCLIDNGLYEDAKEQLQKTLDSKQEAFGNYHHETLITHHTLGLVLMHLKEYEEAGQILADVYNHKKRAMGAKHPSTLTTHHRQANCYLHQGKLNEAVLVFQDVYEKRKEVLGEEKERTLLTKNDIGLCYMKMKNYEGALEIFDSIYPIQERLFTERKVNTFTTKFNLATCYIKRDHVDEWNDYKRAKEMLEDVLVLQESHFGEYHEKTQMTRDLILECQEYLEKKKEK